MVKGLEARAAEMSLLRAIIFKASSASSALTTPQTANLS
ncbi:UNVERIFIED_ORG: hypothetical protein J2W85_001341 [Ensifer adhaerens]|nr:hypothetical protein [Ensifer adhaerens]